MTSPDHPLLPARYRLGPELGRGGMGVVYLAEDTEYDRQVAVKIMLPDVAAAVGPERFLREIRITAQLHHPNILPLLDSGMHEGTLYYVLPRATGGSLRDRIRPGTPLDVEEVVPIIASVAAALDHAHARNIIHRDVKPANVLFTDGQAMITDFGLAKALFESRDGLSRTGVALGTPGYMSPEQAAGRDLTPSTDVCSLAAVAYEACVGTPPVTWAASDEIRLGRFLELPPDHRDRLDALPGRIEQALVRGLALRPADRATSAGELAMLIDRAVHDRPQVPESQVSDVLARAAELDTDSSAGAGLSMGAVEQAAAGAGIPPLLVRKAANPVVPKPPPLPRPEHLVRTAAPPRRIRTCRIVQGDLSDETVGAMIDELEHRLRVTGHRTDTGRRITWSPAGSTDDAHQLVLSVTRHADHVEVDFEQEVSLQGTAALSFPVGATGGAGLGVAIAQALQLGDPGLVVLGLLLAAGGATWATRLTLGMVAVSRQGRLDDLADAILSVIDRE